MKRDYYEQGYELMKLLPIRKGMEWKITKKLKLCLLNALSHIL